MLILFKEIRPLMFFGLLALAFASISLVLSIPVFFTYIDTGLVPRFPTAILSTGLVLLSGIFMMSGLILDSIARAHLEQKRMWYLLNSYKKK
jgi:hypothetical protein